MSSVIKNTYKLRQKCVLLTCDNGYLSNAAETYANNLFDLCHVSRHKRSDKTIPQSLYDTLNNQEVDYLFNFLAPIIIPKGILEKVTKSSINFHPAPPEWPGVGSASFALYENEKTFGACAHLMHKKVDSGPIIRTTRFPILTEDTCETLFSRALNFSLFLFYEVLYEIYCTGTISLSGEKWKGKTTTRAQFEKWMTLTPESPVNEIHRKVRALRHSLFPGPYIEIDGLKFELPPNKSKA